MKVKNEVTAYETDDEVSVFVENDDEKLTIERILEIMFEAKIEMFLQDSNISSEIKYKIKTLRFTSNFN